MTEEERLQRIQQQLQLENDEHSRTTGKLLSTDAHSRDELEADLLENRWKRLYELVPDALDAYEDILNDPRTSATDRRAVADTILDRAGLTKKREIAVEDTGISSQTLIEAFAGLSRVFGIDQNTLRNVTQNPIRPSLTHKENSDDPE